MQRTLEFEVTSLRRRKEDLKDKSSRRIIMAHLEMPGEGDRLDHELDDDDYAERSDLTLRFGSEEEAPRIGQRFRVTIESI